MEYLLNPGRLLDRNGKLYQTGYSSENVRRYYRLDVGASDFRIKEWDCYTVVNPGKYALTLAVADLGAFSVLHACVNEFGAGNKCKTVSGFMPLGSLMLPSKSEFGEARLSVKGDTISFFADGKSRSLQALIADFSNGEKFTVDITLTDEPKAGLVTALPFERGRQYFAYNQRLSGFSVSGNASVGDKTYEFSDPDSYACLDWCRGVLPGDYSYSSAFGYSETESSEISLFLGSDTSQTDAASENGLIVDGVLYKLGGCEYFYGGEMTGASYKSKQINIEFIPTDNYTVKLPFALSRKTLQRAYGTFCGSVETEEISLEIHDMPGFITVNN